MERASSIKVHVVRILADQRRAQHELTAEQPICAEQPRNMHARGGTLEGRTLCQAASCQSAWNENIGAGQGRVDAGRFVCIACRDRLVNDLLNLPGLYADCNGGAGPEVVLVIRTVRRKSTTSDSMSPAAAEIRSAIRTILASWAGLVAGERRVQPPARDILALARFLCRHVEWLTRHPAAGDLVDEVRDLTRTARNIAYPSGVRRVPVGWCPDGDCNGELFALIRHHDDIRPSEIICTISSDHSWPVTRWTKLARQVRAASRR